MFLVSQKLKNDIHISLCFTALFTALNTLSHIQKTLTVSIQNDNPNYTADGYVCFGIMYTSLALCMWLSPAIIVVLGRKATMILGAVFASLLVTFYFENVLLTYITAAFGGIGGALLWTGQANYLVLNSEMGNVYQSISIFWMLFNTSYLFGNAFTYFQFHDEMKPIDRSMRGRIALLLLGFILTAVVIFLGLKPPVREDSAEKKVRKSPSGEIKKAFSIAADKNILISCTLFVYAGLNITFLSVLAASMGFSKYLSSNSKEYAPLSGFVQGFGDIAGCCLCLSLSGGKSFKLRSIFTVGCLGSIIAYVITFLGLPDSAVYSYTEQLPIIKLPVMCFLAANMLVGCADACLHIEIYQFLGTLYPNDSAPAFAVFKFIRYLATAVGFYYGNLMGLRAQVTIILIFAILGLISYHYLLRVIEPTNQKNDKSAPSPPIPIPALRGEETEHIDI